MTTAQFGTLIASLVAAGRPFVPTVETDTALQVERGSALAARALGRAIATIPPPREQTIDAAGHCRQVYRPLLDYARLLVSPPSPDRPGTAVELVADGSMTAANGEAVAAAAWGALVASLGSGDGSGLFLALAERQQPNGALLHATPSDNPETHWYHELVTLHAMANYALTSGNARVWVAVRRASSFHLNETEPDHATGQPWGLPAFIRVAGAQPLAEAVLHAVSAHQPSGPSGVALLLLADTLYGFKRFPPSPAVPENVAR